VSSKDVARHDDLVAKLRERFGAAVIDVDRSFDDCAVTVDRAAIHDVLAYLKNEHRFNLLMDIAGIDCRRASVSRSPTCSTRFPPICACASRSRCRSWT
jgi:NADH:ubiquinone oxidoreductase subunit C